MENGTPTGETVKPGDSQTTVTTTAPVQGNAVDPAEVERLRKEAEQAKMRANQLENQLKERQAKEEAERQKQLEENEEWKTIANQKDARLKEIEAEKEQEQRQKELKAATDSVLSEYPEAVQEIAKEAGISASDSTDEAKEALKAKLERIKEKLPINAVGGNNPVNPSQTKNKLSSDEMKMALKTEQGFHDQISNLPSVAAMLKKR